MGQNAPYLCIAKRVTGHGVYSNPFMSVQRQAADHTVLPEKFRTSDRLYHLFSAYQSVYLGTHVPSAETIVYIYHGDSLRAGIQHGKKR